MKRADIKTVLLALLLFFTAPFAVKAQDSTAAAKEEPTAISPSFNFITIQKGDSSIDLKVTMMAKVKGSMIRLNGQKVSYFAVTDSAETEIGSAVTNTIGIAVFNCKAAAVPAANKEGKVHFIARYTGNKLVESAEGEMTIKRAVIVLTPVKGDSLWSVEAKLIALSGDTAVKETTLGIFVKRLFNPFKIGDGATDDAGALSVEIPRNLPGDAKGNLVLLAKLDENEEFGNLETSISEPWGVPVSDEVKELPRALWSPHPPIWMLVTFITLLTVVWGHYVVIVWELIRLRKERDHTTQTA
jgi:hypothetical protein